jgi:hypothetical protein
MLWNFLTGTVLALAFFASTFQTFSAMTTLALTDIDFCTFVVRNMTRTGWTTRAMTITSAGTSSSITTME